MPIKSIRIWKLESIQGTWKLSLKMGRGDEQKPPMHCIRQKSVLISDLQKCHLSQTMVSSNRCVGRLGFDWIDSDHNHSWNYNGLARQVAKSKRLIWKHLVGNKGPWEKSPLANRHMSIWTFFSDIEKQHTKMNITFDR